MHWGSFLAGMAFVAAALTVILAACELLEMQSPVREPDGDLFERDELGHAYAQRLADEGAELLARERRRHR